MSRSKAARWSPLLVLLHACTDDPSATTCAGLPLEERTACLVAAMTLDEKIAQMHGVSLVPIDDLYHTAENVRLGLPGLRMVDGPRGARAGNATAFPVAMARGATWDPELEERVGEAIGLEVAAKGGNVLLAPTINLLRHPGWGRAQETYGEDTIHLGRMGAAFIVGAQRHVMASAKHFAANSIEDTRFDVDVTIDERTLREQYLPHFRAAVEEARVASVMSAYNQVNGHYCAENEHLLRDILKGDWGFDGFVESDWVLGTRSTVPSALAGLDIEMPAPFFYGDDLRAAVEGGEVGTSVVDEAVTRIVRKKLAFAIDAPAPVDPAVVESEEHQELAREVANEALVLLKNDAALPLGPDDTVALIGALADVANLGDEGSSAVHPTSAITPAAGLIGRLGEARVTLLPDDVVAPGDEALVTAADAAVVVVGLTAEDEGESIGDTGGDRATLALSPAHEALIAQVAALHARTIVVIEGGSAVTMGFVAEVEAILLAWYPGQRGGLAIADVLRGEVSPSGKLPITIPVTEDQLPVFDHTSDAVTYGYFHGYRHVDHEGLTPLFPFGHGLGYTTFRYDAIEPSDPSAAADATVSVEVTVTNTGTRAGTEVVQLYAAFDAPPLERAPIELKAFERVTLEAGETGTVGLELDVADLAYWDGGFRVEPGSYRLLAGGSSRDLPLETVVVVE
jgi:beta-glucosidase